MLSGFTLRCGWRRSSEVQLKHRVSDVHCHETPRSLVRSLLQEATMQESNLGHNLEHYVVDLDRD